MTTVVRVKIVHRRADFGFLDGISNPAVTGFTTTVLPGQSLVPAGTILTGRTGDTGVRPTWALDGSFLVRYPFPPFLPDTSYVDDKFGSLPFFIRFSASSSNSSQNLTSMPPPTPFKTLRVCTTQQFCSSKQRSHFLLPLLYSGTLSAAQGAKLFAARLVGRWQSGAPLDLAPLADDPSLGADPNRNNNFDYSHAGSDLTSDQSRCPFSAHIRKTRPRSDLGNTNLVNQAIRAGIPYGPEVSDSESNAGVTSQDRGLAFGESSVYFLMSEEPFPALCLFVWSHLVREATLLKLSYVVEYQSSIGNGFRFQQVAWANNPRCVTHISHLIILHTLFLKTVELIERLRFMFGKNQTVGLDPIIGQAGNDAARITWGVNSFDASRNYSIPAFVKSQGGEYFFSPSISALKNTIAR